MSRRSRAVLIRARQEVSKRLEQVALARSQDGPARVTTLLSPEARTRAQAGTPLRDILASAAPSRFPLAHLATRPDTPSDADQIVAEARAVARGEWTIFGQRATAFEQTGDWTADPLDGRPWPAGHWTSVAFVATGRDVKHVWELNRHHGIVRLAQGYHLTGDESLAQEAVRLLDNWTIRNPPRQGINWTASLEVAFRAIAWCWIWQLTHRSPAWTEERATRFLWQLWHHARYVERYDSIHHSPNTHLTGEALGLLYVGATFPQLRRSARWLRFGTGILVEEIEHQFLADGFHYERATGYHRYHLEFYLHALLLLRRHGTVPERTLGRLRARLRDGFAAGAALLRPDGSWPVFGDEDGGSTIRLAAAPAGDPRTLLAAGAAVFREPTWLPCDADAPPATSLAWWLCDTESWSALQAMTPRRPDSFAATLPAAGYLVARDDWSPDAWYCAVDAGPHGGEATGHAHTDLAHVEIGRGATRLIADPGSLAYTRDPEHRAWHRSELAHARPSVEGVQLAEPNGPFGWRRVAPTPGWEVADDGHVWQCRVYYAYGEKGRIVRHERQVVLVRGAGVVVCDWLHAPGALVRWSWPVAAPPEEVELGPGYLRANGLALHWQMSPTGDEHPRLEERLFAPSYASPERGALLVTATRCTDRATGIACVLDSRAPMPILEMMPDEIHCVLERYAPDGARSAMRLRLARGQRITVTG